MTQIIPNTQAVPQVIGSTQVVVNGTDHQWLANEIIRGLKVLHVGDYSFSAEETGGSTAELKLSLQRDVGSGWEDVPGEGAAMTFTAGQDRRFRTLCKVPYYEGIDALVLPKYRLVAECPTGQVTLHSAEENDGVPSGQWKAEYEFEGDNAPPTIETWILGTPAESLIYSGAVNHNNLLVVCARSGTGNRIMTSSDGLSWTTRASAGDYNWRRLATNGSIIVCVETGGRIMTSPDGITWTMRTPPRIAGFGDVCWTGSSFIAVSLNVGYTEQVYRSLDGINWSLIDNNNIHSWYCVASGNGIVVMLSNQGYAMYSDDDGLSWYSVAIDSRQWQSVTHDGTRFVAVADSGYTAYGDGTSWATGPQLTLAYPEHIYHAHSQLVVCASDKSGTDVAFSVDHGETWNYQSTPIDAFWNCLTSNENRFVCVGNIGVMTAEVS